MKPENAIEVRNVTKSFKVYLDKGNTMKEKVLFKNRRRYEERKVLNNISFSVARGEAVGLIGHNGCGKSTTLKLLTKIMYPDKGNITMRGRVSSLIELGAGFHEDMSGRENIYINASIFGLSRREIDERIEDIISFSELEDYIDNPVRTYSSGMYMRLAFSVAINVDADILLVDEILAVGDVNFQAKCFNRLREIKGRGTTIVIVSHSMDQIEQICDRSIWIHGGTVKKEGLPREVHPEYLDFMGEKRQEMVDREKQRQEKQDLEEEKKRWGNGKARIQKIDIVDNAGNEKSVIKTGEVANIRIYYDVREVVEDAVFGIGIFRGDGVQCYGTNTHIDKIPEFKLSENGMVQVTLDSMSLLPGQYILDVAIESGMGTPVDYYRDACRFEVFSDIGDVGIMRIGHSWKINNKD